MTAQYDIIGDIHGHARTLEALLDKLGYRLLDGVYRHPQRRMIFLGDFVDRGPEQRRVLAIVRPMIDGGYALSVMGNHEFNAIAYATRHPVHGDYLRPHADRNRKQHQAFLDAYAGDPIAYADVIDWLKTLPLWLDLAELRVVHACWDSKWIRKLATPVMNESRLIHASDKNRWEFAALETLLKGKEIPLRQGLSFHDKDGNLRRQIRVRWWDQSATTYRTAYMGPASAITHIPDDEISGDHLVEYARTDPPLLLGHYWMEGEPQILAPNIACLDYSVAKPGGKLLAYRWDGERTLSNDKFVWVDRLEV